MSAPTRAVFLSYAREDASAVRHVAEALRGFGIEVWFDQNELRGGDAWDQAIRRQIKDCALFLPVISSNTQARREGYFRLEWKLATQRMHTMADGTPFLLPVVIDNTTEASALVPEEFRSVQWTFLTDGMPRPEFIERVRRLLEAPGAASVVAGSAPAALPAAPSLPRKSSSRGWWLTASMIAAVAAVAGGWFFLRPPPAAKSLENAERPMAAAAVANALSIAVLPFANLSGDKDQEYFSDGLTEEILNALARERNLRVSGRASSFFFKGRNTPLTEIAKTLGVAQLVEGSVSRVGNRVRIRVQLTRALDGFSEAIGSFDRELTDVFAIYDEITRAVVTKLAPGRADASANTAAATQNPEAYDLYLRGRALQTRAANYAADAATFYERAVALDPKFALAWARLAEARFRPFGARSDRSPQLVKSTREAIDRALAANPDLPEALIVRANWLRDVEGDLEAARRDLRRAESLQPPSASLRAAQAGLARRESNWPEMMRLAREAIALDPQNGDATNAWALMFRYRGDFVEAERLFARAVSIQGPGVATPYSNYVTQRGIWRGALAKWKLLESSPRDQAGRDAQRVTTLIELGRMEEARALALELEQGAEEGAVTDLRPSLRVGLLELRALGFADQARTQAERGRVAVLAELARGNRAPGLLGRLALLHIVLDERQAAYAVLRDWENDARSGRQRYLWEMEFAFDAVRYYALLGDADKCTELLETLMAAGYRFGHGLGFMLEYEPVRADPRFQRLMEQEKAWADSLPDPTNRS
jgi:TolB-like protein